MDTDKINKWRAYLCLGAEVLDAYRVVPRIVLALYVYFLYKVGIWFMSLPEPSTQHAAFIATVVGASAAIIGLYQNSGRKWSEQGFKFWPFKEGKLEVQDGTADK